MYLSMLMYIYFDILKKLANFKSKRPFSDLYFNVNAIAPIGAGGSFEPP